MPIDFYLHSLDANLDISGATIQAQAPVDEMTAQRAKAHLWVDASAVRNVFRFGTNAVDINDVSAEDMHFFVDADGFRDLSSTTYYSSELDAAAAGAGTKSGQLTHLIGHSYVEDSVVGEIPSFIVDPNGIHYTADNKGLIKDVMRNLAHDLFKTQYGVDIFNNETDLCNNMASRFSELLTTGGAIHTALNDASGNTVAQDVSSNVGFLLLKNIAASARDRLSDLSANTDIYVGELSLPGGDGENVVMRQYKMPLVAGDTLRFEVTVVYANDQRTIVSGSGKPDNRCYEMILHLK